MSTTLFWGINAACSDNSLPTFFWAINAASIGNSLPTFRYNLSVSSSRVKNPRKGITITRCVNSPEDISFGLCRLCKVYIMYLPTFCKEKTGMYYERFLVPVYVCMCVYPWITLRTNRVFKLYVAWLRCFLRQPNFSVCTSLVFPVTLRPTRTMTSLFLRFLDDTQRRATVSRTPLDEWSARRRDLYLTTHNNHNTQISTPPKGFEPTIPASERSPTHAVAL